MSFRRLFEPHMNQLRMTRRSLMVSAVAAALPSTQAIASERRYRMKLIAGEPLGDDLRAGIDIELDPGWKTYWRMPGEAGVPPQFDWSASQNVSAVELLWPAPSRFIDAGGETVGYKGRVVFPLRVTPLRAAKAVQLGLSMFFGVCKEICIPVNARAELASWQADPVAEALLRSFEQRVPAQADRSSSLYIEHATANLVSGKLELTLTFATTLPADLEVFVESKYAGYFPAGRSSGSRTYSIPVAGPPDLQRLKGSMLKLTMVGGRLALEQEVTVD
jgi:DsbC/DsbD-like thiol-disulfide interchange protein